MSGLAPSLGTHAGNVARALRATGVATVDRRRRWLRQSLVVAQVALAMVLLVAGGLMLRTWMAVHALDLGFSPDNVLTFGVDLRDERYRGLVSMRAFSRDLISRLETLPGVEAAGVGSVPLLGGVQNGFQIEGREELIVSAMDVPSPGYFRALGIRLAHGRFFLDGDNESSERVAIVNRAFARAAWGSEQAVGKRLQVEQRAKTTMTIVGVVDDIRMSSLEAEVPPVVYLPFLQSGIATFTNYVVRTTGDPHSTMPLVREAVRGIDPALALSRIATMEERIARAVAPRAFNLWLIGVFSFVALILAIVGVYGLISESVARRTSEIGVRMALGARRGDVVRLVLGRTAVMTGIGIVLGLAAAAATTRSLESMLFGLTPLDPTTFVAVPLLFGLAAILATVLPTRRATKIDPVIALRCE